MDAVDTTPKFSDEPRIRVYQKYAVELQTRDLRVRPRS